MNLPKKLVDLIRYTSQNSPYYKRLFSEKGIRPEGILNSEEFEQLPFTTKDNLAQFNEDFLCVDKTQVADYVTTSGTLSSPVSFYLTANDSDRLAQNESASLAMTGANEKDVFQLMVTMDKQFMAGLAYYLGVQKMGGGAVRIGPSSPITQIQALLKFESTVLIAVPSFIVKLIQVAKANEIDLSKSAVRSIVCIGEPIRNVDFSLNELGKRIVGQWDVELFSTYASTEMGAAFTECKSGNGGHLNDDLLYLEVVNDEGDGVNNGELGEVVVSTLGVTGMPLLRYKTGDLCHVYYNQCSCGLTTPRIGPVVGRKQQMIKFKGTTIFPPAIFDVLASKNVGLYQVRISKNEFNIDDVTVVLPSSMKDEKLTKELQVAFKSKIRVTPYISFEPDESLQKSVLPVDKRKPTKIVFE